MIELLIIFMFLAFVSKNVYLFYLLNYVKISSLFSIIHAL